MSTSPRRLNPGPPDGSWKRLAIVGTVLGLGGLGVGYAVASHQKPKKRRKSKACKATTAAGGTLAGIRYEEFVTGGADPESPLPMVIVFHGRGSAPKYLRPILEDIQGPARVIVPYGPLELGKNRAWWKTRAKGDQATLAREMASASAQLAPFLDEIVACRPTKGDTAVVAGHSQGGMVALALASTQADKVDMAVGGSAWLPEALWGSRNWAPIVLLHGTDDPTIPYDRTAAMVDTLDEKGVSIQLVPIEGHGHSLSGLLKAAWMAAIEKALATG